MPLWYLNPTSSDALSTAPVCVNYNYTAAQSCPVSPGCLFTTAYFSRALTFQQDLVKSVPLFFRNLLAGSGSSLSA